MLVYGIEISAGPEAEFEATLNGVPFARKRGAESYAASLPLQADVIAGTNAVAITVAAPARVAGPLAARPGMFIDAVVTLERSSRTGKDIETSAEPIARIEWRTEKGEQVALPKRLEASFTASLTGGPVWLDAAPLRDGLDDAAALARVRTLAQMLRDGDIEGFTGTCRLKYQDMARAYPMVGDAARMRMIDTRELHALLSTPGAEVVEPESLSPSFRVHAGRLIEGFARDGQSLLRVIVPDRPQPRFLKLMLAKFGSELVPVR